MTQWIQRGSSHTLRPPGSERPSTSTARDEARRFAATGSPHIWTRRPTRAFLLVGEAAGYRGARVSGIPFTSERQLTGTGPAEATATIVQHVLSELQLDALCWNVVPTHPGTSTSNRRPTRAEVVQAAPFLDELTNNRHVIAVGRLAAAVTGAPYVRHPSHGGASAFRAGLTSLCC